MENYFFKQMTYFSFEIINYLNKQLFLNRTQFSYA